MKRDNSRHREKYKIIGKNIRKIRKRKKLSQEELAFMVSSTRNYIGCIERGEKFASLAFFFDLATALECNINFLFENF